MDKQFGYAYDGDYSEHKIHQASEKLKDLGQSRIIAMICQNELTNHTLVIVLGRTGFGHGLPPRQAAMCSSAAAPRVALASHSRSVTIAK